MNAHEAWEIASFIVTVFGLPRAIGIFIHEHRGVRNNEEEEVYLRLPVLRQRAKVPERTAGLFTRLRTERTPRR